MSNNETLPRLFDDKGVLLPDIDTSKMDAPTLERLEAIRAAYRENERAQDELAASNQDVTDALAEIRDAESFHNAHWPRQSFHDLWKENFGGGPRQRMGLG
jgi:hypothetical protein